MVMATTAASRLAGVIKPVIPQVAALMQRRPDCLSLAQGMVDWGPPAAVGAAVRAALEHQPPAALDRYGPLAGDPAFLEVIRQELGVGRGLDLDGSALLVTAGSNMAFNAIAQVLIDPGDELLLPVPWYFNHAMAVQLAGGRPVPVAAGLIPDPDRLAAAIGPRCRGIVTTSPNNPSGVVIPAPVLDAINRLCAERGLVHIHDEAYAEFVHGPEPHRSPGRLSGSAGHTITLSSLSKTYGMAGWRLGYMAVPEALLPALVKVQDTVLICPPLLNQQAGLAALEAGPTWCAPRIERLGDRRRQLLKALGQAREAEVPIRLLAEPDGAFYALLEFTTDLPSWTLIERLVLEHGVALLPGECFALPTGPGRVGMRLSYGMLGDVELDRALGRLITGLKALG